MKDSCVLDECQESSGVCGTININASSIRSLTTLIPDYISPTRLPGIRGPDDDVHVWLSVYSIFIAIFKVTTAHHERWR